MKAKCKESAYRQAGAIHYMFVQEKRGIGLSEKVIEIEEEDNRNHIRIDGMKRG